MSLSVLYAFPRCFRATVCPFFCLSSDPFRVCFRHVVARRGEIMRSSGYSSTTRAMFLPPVFGRLFPDQFSTDGGAMKKAGRDAESMRKMRETLVVASTNKRGGGEVFRDGKNSKRRLLRILPRSEILTHVSLACFYFFLPILTHNCWHLNRFQEND